jgi:hypothetical protein
MRFTETLVALAALAVGANAASASADGGKVITTVITDDYTTFCPTPTVVAHKNITFTVTTPTTLTFTSE